MRSGNLVFPGDRSGAYDAAKQKLSTPKVEVPKINTPPQTQGLLGTRNVPSTQELIQQRGGAPKPQFGPGSTNTGQSFPKPPTVTRDAGAFARQRLMAKPPVAPVVRPNLLSKVRGGPVSTALNIATGAALDNYVVQPVAKAGGDALARTILDLTGKGDRARQVNPELYGKSGPNLTPEIVKGIQQRSKLAQQSAETQAASQPKPEPTGERSLLPMLKSKKLLKQMHRGERAAADFDKPLLLQERQERQNSLGVERDIILNIRENKFFS